MIKLDNYIDICLWIIKQEGFEPKDVRVKSRLRELVFTRQLAMYFSDRFTKATQIRIGLYFSRDHATVIHAIKTINNLIDTDRRIREKVKDYVEKLKNLNIPQRRMLIFRIYAMTRFAYIDVKTPEEIIDNLLFFREKEAIRDIYRFVRYEKYFSKFNK